MVELSKQAHACWQKFLETVDDRDAVQARLLEAFSIGNSAESRNAGAQLIISGTKTATSSLPWEFEGGTAPYVGAISIVLDGAGEPVCIVESIDVAIKPFSAADAQFAYDYGEWDRTLDTWREKNWGYYVAMCEHFGRSATSDMPLIYERFRVIFRCQ